MPILQMIPPANPYALALDHDYPKLTAEDSFLKEKLVKFHNIGIFAIFLTLRWSNHMHICMQKLVRYHRAGTRYVIFIQIVNIYPNFV